MVLTFTLRYFKESGVNPADNVTYEANSLVLSCAEYDPVSTNSVFRFSSDVLFDSKNSISINDEIVVSDVTYPYRLFFNEPVGFQISLDYPHYLLIDPSAFSYLASFLEDVGGTTDTSLLDSLNGNFGSYPDGAQVVVQGLTTRTYSVQSSSLGWDSPSTGSLIITYRLKDTDDNFLEAPHVLLTLKA